MIGCLIKQGTSENLERCLNWTKVEVNPYSLPKLHGETYLLPTMTILKIMSFATSHYATGM
jgi:hypothetical protein